MVPSYMGKKMNTIRGYKKWKRIPRPLGPGNVAKGLLECLPKLDELRKYGHSTKSDTQADASEVEDETEELTPSNNDSSRKDLPTWALGRLQLSDKPEASAPTPASGPTRSSASHTINRASLPGAPARSPKTSQEEGERKEHSGPSLLIVDDNSMNLKLLWTFFKRSGYLNCEQATDGAEALGKVQQRPEGFEIILMGTLALRPPQEFHFSTNGSADLSMPIMDGFEATRQIRSLENERGRQQT
jgi:CheY-like chemotaxis protein